MSDIFLDVLFLLLGVLTGGFLCFIYYKFSYERRTVNAKKRANDIIKGAKSRASKMEDSLKWELREFERSEKKRIQEEFQNEKLESDLKKLQEKKERQERDHERQMKSLNDKQNRLEQQERQLLSSVETYKANEKELRHKSEELQKKLDQISSLSKDQIKHMLRTEMEESVREELSQKFFEMEQDFQKKAEEKSKQMLAQAMAKYASEVSSERAITVIPLAGNDEKGRIIGREGRNIRSLEASCGVDILIDEVPDSVMVSCFDPVRRAVAEKAIKILLEDKKIHPAKIESVVSRVKKDIVNSALDLGQQACSELGLSGIHPEILKVLGRLKYYQHGGQNLYAYLIDVANLMGILAAELKLPVEPAKRVGLLHDIGWGLSHKVEKSHAVAGAEFLEKYGERSFMYSAVLDSEKMNPETLLGQLLQAATELCDSRKGVQKGRYHIERIQDLESIANGFDGVVNSYALKSGQQVRVIVDSSHITDEQASMLVRDIGNKIRRQKNISPLKVVVVRETRFMEFAR